jgi:PAS domain S-box-containing protein
MAVADHEPVLDAVADAIIVHDPETGDVLAVNDACCDMFGREEAALVGSELADLAADADARAAVTDQGHVRRAR